MDRRYRPWLTHEERQLATAWRNGMTTPAIAVALQRTRNGVQFKAREMGLEKRKAGRRASSSGAV